MKNTGIVRKIDEFIKRYKEIYYNDNSLLIGCTISVLSIIVFIIMCGLNCINLRRNICAETISQ